MIMNGCYIVAVEDVHVVMEKRWLCVQWSR